MQKNSVGESFIVALNSGTEKVWRRGGGGAPTSSIENLSFHSAEKFRRVIIYCCITFLYQKTLDERGGEYQGFPSKIFRLTVPKDYVGESSLLHYFHYLKCLDKRGREIQKLRRNIFFSQCRKFPLENPLLLH